MHCHRCGAANMSGARYCSMCGATISAVPSAPTLRGSPQLELATKGSRLIHSIVDSLAVFLLMLVLIFCYGALLGMVGADTKEMDEAGAFQAAMVAFLYCGYLGYYILSEFLFGRTLGQRITRSRVIRKDGTQPRLGQVIGRTLARFIPFDAISLLVSREGIAWHDAASGTRVISSRPPPRASS